MAATEAPAPGAPPRSQSALSPIFLWILLAAAVFRVVTGVMDRGESAGGGIVAWQPRQDAPGRSAKSGKPILYDFTAAWCGPCKLLDKDWEDASVAGRINESFVPVRIVDRVREDGRNEPDVAELVRRYEVSGFPTLVAVDAEGRLIARHEGYRNRETLVAFLEEAKGRIRP
jgi:thiol-disulfide isomerase/thioredoxin